MYGLSLAFAKPLNIGKPIVVKCRTNVFRVCAKPTFLQGEVVSTRSKILKIFKKTKLDEVLTLAYGIDRCTRNLADIP